jgi:hypothetical protein
LTSLASGVLTVLASGVLTCTGGGAETAEISIENILFVAADNDRLEANAS